MARKATTVVIPPTFVGAFYDVKAGVYVATRADGSLTVGRIGVRGVNVRAGLVAPNAQPVTVTD
jgi:hypothetical protein